MPNVGAHVSVAGGLHNCFANAKKIGAQSIQIFGASPRQWKAAIPSKDEVEKYKQAEIEAKNIAPVYLHAAYLVNLASANKNLREKSIKSLTQHLRIAKATSARGLIFHLGSAGDESVEKGIKYTIEGMKQVLAAVPGDTLLLMENSSGGGNKLGANFEELKLLLDGVRSKRVKFCFDTAHAFEAGMIEYSKIGIKKFMDEWGKKLRFGNLDVIHANDSKTDFASHKDRHENIGEGKIGKQELGLLAKQKQLRCIPWILEVPGFKGEGPDKKNIQILQKLF